MAKPAFAVFLALLITACGAVAPSPGELPKPPAPYAVLAAWKNFPAGVQPRPIIAFSDTVEYIPPAGFPDGDRKLAWTCNRFQLAPGLTLQPDAAGAYALLMSERAATANSASECATLAPLVVTGARKADAGFPTDRGTMQLPAWLFDVPEVNMYVGYLAVDPSKLWKGATMVKEGRGAKVSSDGLTLKIGVMNPGNGPCDSGQYTASAAESPSAVAVAVLRTPPPSPTQNVACDLVGRFGFITVSLSQPLGARVLLDENGDVGPACPESGEC